MAMIPGRAVWRCTGQEVGAQCVMMAGMEMKLQWYAESWDIPLMASYVTINFHILSDIQVFKAFFKNM